MSLTFGRLCVMNAEWRQNETNSRLLQLWRTSTIFCDGLSTLPKQFVPAAFQIVFASNEARLLPREKTNGFGHSPRSTTTPRSLGAKNWRENKFKKKCIYLALTLSIKIPLK